jgi:hypothetical protein
VRHVWVAGRQVVNDGRCTGVDELELAESVRERMPSVRRSAQPLLEQMHALRSGIRRIMARAEAIDTEADRYLG